MCEILDDNAMDCNEDEQPNTEIDVYNAAEPSLLNLPVELFLTICSFMDAHFISSTLSKVCRRFEAILADNELWKYWVYRRMKNTYPALPHLSVWDKTELNWEEACIEIDKEYKTWTNVEKRMKHVVVKDVHFASVDAVLLVNYGDLCISGGRDRNLALWRVPAVASAHIDEHNHSAAKPEKLHHDAHTGWVWDLAADCPDNARMIYSASWDNTVKAWDLESEFTHTQDFKCGMSALSVVTSGNLLFAGLYSNKVLMFDVRAGPDPVKHYKIHKGPILALATRDGQIASVSEDKTLGIWDTFSDRVLKSDVRIPSSRAYPVCISWSPAAMYVGDSKGTIHIVDPEAYVNRGSHELWPEPEVTMPASKITGIYQGLGSMIVSSDRGDIKFLYNSFPPEEYMSLKSSTWDITKLQYQNDVMAIGTCDSTLEFWIPTERNLESEEE